jgi:hypothetical protein
MDFNLSSRSTASDEYRRECARNDMEWARAERRERCGDAWWDAPGTEAPLTLSELVPYYMLPPCPFTKAQAVHYIVSDRLRGGVARGKGSNARKRAQKAQSGALAGKRKERGWLTWNESLLDMKLDRQKQLDAEGKGLTTISTYISANIASQPRDEPTHDKQKTATQSR